VTGDLYLERLVQFNLKANRFTFKSDISKKLTLLPTKLACSPTDLIRISLYRPEFFSLNESTLRKQAIITC
jgi:hypothetical protein